MGLSTVQYYIYNEKQIELDFLRKRIEDAIGEVSIIKSKSSNWVGVGFIDDFYNYEKNLHVIHDLSQSVVIGALIYDSDSLYLNLKVNNTDLLDTVHVGRFEPSGYYDEELDEFIVEEEFEKAKGNLDLWQSLLKKDATTKQLVEAFESNPVFVEEALVDVLDLLGIEDSFFNELLQSYKA